MTILFDIGNPKQVWMFKKIVENINENHIFTCRNRKNVRQLLDELNIHYKVTSNYGTNLLGKFLSFRKGRKKLLELSQKADLLISCGSPFCSFVSEKTGKLHLIFLDTELGSMNSKILFKGNYKVFTPESYRKKHKNHKKYEGFHELAYLKDFKPNPKILDKYELKSEDTFYVTRETLWTALHDTGLKQKPFWKELTKDYNKVIELKENNVKNMKDVHHLLYYATLFIGDSGSIAKESVVLGTPAICTNPRSINQGVDLEFINRNLMIFAKDEKELYDIIDGCCCDWITDWKREQQDFLSEKIDVLNFMTKQIKKNT